jgi:hypothetical protein
MFSTEVDHVTHMSLYDANPRSSQKSALIHVYLYLRKYTRILRQKNNRVTIADQTKRSRLCASMFVPVHTCILYMMRTYKQDACQ